MGARRPARSDGRRGEQARTSSAQRSGAGRPALVLLVVVLLLHGCGSDPGPTGDEDASSTPQPLSTASAEQPGPVATSTPTEGGRGAPGAPVAPGGQQGRPSPVRVPLPLDELRGRLFGSGLADLRTGIARACGGNQCVTVRKTVDRGPDGDERPCDTILEVVGASRTADGQPFVDTVRGATLTVLVNLACPAVPTPSGGSSSPGTPGSSRPGTPTGPGTPSASP